MRVILQRNGTVFLLLYFLVVFTAAAQVNEEREGIHQIESRRHTLPRVDSIPQSPTGVDLPRAGAPLSKRVFGYHPYWSAGAAHLSYDFSALSTIGYFSYEVDTATGRHSSLRGWSTTPLIQYAHERGVKVVLVVTNFGLEANDKILGNSAKRSVLAESIVETVRGAGGDGVNIDFEQVRATQRENLVLFMQDLASRMRSRIPNAEISMAIPAVDWSGAFDVERLAGICDYLVMMGYDYHWSTAPNAGPVAPLEGEAWNVTRSVDTYLSRGVPPAKLLLGVPWYGYEWPVVDSSRKSAATGRGTSVFYLAAEPTAQASGKMFDAATKSPWYRIRRDTLWRQGWYDDSLSLALKYDLANKRALGGIGIWALGYEGGRQEIWRGIVQAFSAPSSVRGRRTILRMEISSNREDDP